jgi:hypothetical protein
MKTATEEAISQYTVHVTCTRCTRSGAYCALGSLTTTDNPGSTCCTKKHSQVVAFHDVRECNEAGIIDVLKVDTANNFSDPFTKALDTTHFLDLFQHIYRSPANVAWSQQGEKTTKKR